MANIDPNSTQSTLNVDPDAKAATVAQASQAPAGSGNSALPAVGTNEVDKWSTWDPNLWWTDWSIPAKPQATWELWFDWVNQLKALVPAVNQASSDWQTLTSQFDNALQTVRTMRGDLTSWTGPSAQTMSQSLDNLQTSISTKADAIRNNPMTLQNLAQSITDTVGPMTALDAQYQQVLTNDAECRQVAMQGQPIMIGLATKLLQAGTALENSAQTSNLAPQPTPPTQATATSGAQGPTQQLAQVAGPSGAADPGNVSTGSQIPVAVQPAVAGPSGIVDPGTVHAAQQQAMAHTPGVAVSAGQPATAGTTVPAQSSAHMAATPTLAGSSAGTMAPTVSTFSPGAAMPTTGGGMPMTPMVGASGASFGGAPMAAAAMAPSPTPSVASAKSDERENLTVVPILAVPVAGGAGAGTTSGSVAVPAGLQGRTSGNESTAGAIAGVIRPGQQRPKSSVHDEDAPLDAEVFQIPEAGTGMVAARPRQA